MRKCVYHKQLDLDTLVATRGPNFSLSRLESRVSELWKLKDACSLSRRAMLRKWGVGDDLPLNFHPATIRASAGLVRSPTLDRPKVEFSGLCHVGGLDAPTGVMRETGGLLPMAPCGRSSL
jgi:hypothetical protein